LKLEWSPIQLKLENRYRIFPIDILRQVKVNLDKVQTIVDFEVIEIISYTDPYLVLMGIDWAFDNLSIINLKKRQMVFEAGYVKLIAPLDPNDEECYVEHVRVEFDVEDLDHLYNITAKWEDRVDPSKDGTLKWNNIDTCSLDSHKAMENW